MKYSVVWTPDAVAELAQVWIDAPDRAAVTAASATLDRFLEQNPFNQRFEVVRSSGTAVHGPLGVDFRIESTVQKVFVTGAWAVNEEFQ